MQESVIATFNDVQFIQGVTPMTQANWQEYFGTTLKSGIYSGFGMACVNGAGVANAVRDGVAIANGIRAEVKTELGYTVIPNPDYWSDFNDRLICLRIHFLSETAEIISKTNLAEKAYSSESKNDMLLRTMLILEYDESHGCTRNEQYYDIPLFYQGDSQTYLFLGRDLRRFINKEPIYTINPYDTPYNLNGTRNRLLSGANYYSALPDDVTETYFPDPVDITKEAILTVETSNYTKEVRLSFIPFLNNFLNSTYVDEAPVPEDTAGDRFPINRRVKYIFSNETWTENYGYFSRVIPAHTKKVFRISFRGATMIHREGDSNYEFNFNFFVEEIYNYQSTLWGAIGGNITDQVDLKTTLDNLESSTSDISETLATKAPIESPALTGIPTAPTAEAGTATTQLATTEFAMNMLDEALHTVTDVLYVETGGTGDGSEQDPFGKISDAVNAAKVGITTQIIVKGILNVYDTIVVPSGKKIVISNSRNGFQIRVNGNSFQGDPTITVDGGELYLDNGYYDIRGANVGLLADTEILVQNGGLLFFNARQHTSEMLDNKAGLRITGYSALEMGGGVVVTTMGRAFLGHNNNTISDITFESTGTGVRVETGGYAVIRNGFSAQSVTGNAFYADNGIIIWNGNISEIDSEHLYRTANGGIVVPPSGLAPLDSPAFTGTPTAPTPASDDNSTKLATTEFVKSGFAQLASPAFTGTPTAPTPATSDNSTKLATTAFVKSAIGKASTDLITAYVGVTGKTPYFDTLQDAVDYIPNNGNIYVNPGMNCGSVSISGKICYITPYNSTTNPAIISELTVTNSSYVQISNIDFVTDDVNLIYVARGSTLVLSASDGDIRFISNCSGTQSPGNFMIRVLQGSKLVTDDDLDFRMSVNDGNHYLIKAEDGSIVTFFRYSTNRDWSATELTDFWSQGSIIIYGECTSSIYGSLLRTKGGQIFKS